MTYAANEVRRPFHSERLAILAEISRERARQDVRFGVQDLPNGTGPKVPDVGTGYPCGKLADWYRESCDTATADGALTYAHILAEEVFEALAEDDPDKLESELIQVGAVTVKWVEKLRRERRRSHAGH